jgi:biotin transport system permease protein
MQDGKRLAPTAAAPQASATHGGPAQPPHFVLDHRVRILLALGFGLLILHTGAVGLGVFAGAAAALTAFLSRRSAADLRLTAAAGIFVGLWTVVKCLVELWSGASVATALTESGLLGLRLGLLILVGLCLALSSSPRKLGLALAWMLRPVLGRRAWSVALALALMIHFLPLTWQTFARLRQTMRLRGTDVPWRQRLILLPQAALRALSQKTWNQTIAIASRGLDEEAAWREPFPANAAHWCLGSAALLAGVFIARL